MISYWYLQKTVYNDRQHVHYNVNHLKCVTVRLIQT